MVTVFQHLANTIGTSEDKELNAFKVARSFKCNISNNLTHIVQFVTQHAH